MLRLRDPFPLRPSRPRRALSQHRPDPSRGTCRRCKYEPLGLDTLPAALLETLYQANLRQRVTVALARLQSHRPQRRIELLINLSQGYLSRLKAGDGIPGAPLVSLLAILAEHPQLLAELERYWTLPPDESESRSDTP